MSLLKDSAVCFVILCSSLLLLNFVLNGWTKLILALLA